MERINLTPPYLQVYPPLPSLPNRVVCSIFWRYTKERAPQASLRASWKEAFVTNAIRLVHPVREIRWPQGLPGCLNPPEEHEIGNNDGVSNGDGDGDGDGSFSKKSGKEEVTFRLREEKCPVTAAILSRVIASLSQTLGPTPCRFAKTE